MNENRDLGIEQFIIELNKTLKTPYREMSDHMYGKKLVEVLFHLVKIRQLVPACYDEDHYCGMPEVLYLAYSKLMDMHMNALRLLAEEYRNNGRSGIMNEYDVIHRIWESLRLTLDEGSPPDMVDPGIDYVISLMALTQEMTMDEKATFMVNMLQFRNKDYLG